MKLKYYTFTLTGVTPLILHQDSVEWSDKMQEWRKDSSNAKKSVAGDDRAPAWRWIGCLPTDGEKVGITADMLLSMLTKAPARAISAGSKTSENLTLPGTGSTISTPTTCSTPYEANCWRAAATWARPVRRSNAHAR